MSRGVSFTCYSVHPQVKKILVASLLALVACGCKRAEEVRYIPSGAMSPTLQVGDRVLVENSVSAVRGQIVTFSSPHAFDPVLSKSHDRSACWMVDIPVAGGFIAQAMNNPACDVYMKRIIAVAGDRVRVDYRGKVSINGNAVDEPYVESYCPVSSDGTGVCPMIDAEVPEGYVLVLGDKRSNSWDGRFWPGGAFVPTSEVRGVARSILLPLDRSRSL